MHAVLLTEVELSNSRCTCSWPPKSRCCPGFTPCACVSDCWSQEELRAAGQEQQRPPPVLKFRPAGGREWLHPCVLLPGLHAAAAATTPQAAGAAGAPARVHISRCCATTRILLLPPAGKPGAEAAGAAASAAQVAAEAEQPRPLRLDVSIRQLQLCLWDDERQRLLPPAGGGEAEAAGSVLGEELFCLSADQLYLHLSRQPQLEGPAGAAAAGAAGPPHAPPLHPWQRQPLLVSTAWLAAGGLQLDSFLPGSEQPVLLTSLPEGSFEGTGGGDSRRPGPPLQLGLVVHHCPAVPGGSSSPADPAADGSGGGGGMSFRNAWVHDLLVQLPTLAVAADDALLLFADRASALLLGGGGGDDYGSNGSGTGGSGEGSSPSPGSGQEGSALQAQQAQQVAGASLQEPAAPLAALQQSLAAEAAGAAASRLYIEQASVESGEVDWEAAGQEQAACCCSLLLAVLAASSLQPVLLACGTFYTAFSTAVLPLALPWYSAAAAGCAHHSGHSGRACGSRHPPRTGHPVAHCRARCAVQVGCGRCGARCTACFG